MSDDETDVYIPVGLVADLLDVSTRQASRYAARVRTRQDGRRILYHRGDVERLAQERGIKHDRPLAVHTEVIPPGQLLDLITQLHAENGQLHETLGDYKARLEHQQKQLVGADDTRQQLTAAEVRALAAEAEAERLRAELERLSKRSLWQRLRGK